MSPKVRDRKERAIKIQERLVETHTSALSEETDDKKAKVLKTKIQRAQTTIENTKNNMR